MFLRENRGQVGEIAIKGLAVVVFAGFVLCLYVATRINLSFPAHTFLQKTLLRDSVAPQTLHYLSNDSSFSSAINLIDSRRVAYETLMLEKEPFRCPVVNVFNVTYPICLLPIHEDIYVSKAAQSAETYWEHEEIAHIVRLLRHLRNSSERHERNVVFVDLGASIGTYSLPILHNGFKVVGVEAQWEAIRRLTLSAYLAANQTDIRKITILHNAITGKTGSLIHVNIGLHPDNAAGSNVVSAKSCSTSACNETVVRTITLDDLLPVVLNKSPDIATRRPQVVIKVDIEASEPDVFTEETAVRFFSETEVVAVQMEWLFTHTIRKKQSLLTFFTRRGYSIRSAAPPRKCLTIGRFFKKGFIGDIMFIQKQFENNVSRVC